MFRGFNLTGLSESDFKEQYVANRLERGTQLFAKDRSAIKKVLDAFITATRTIDGSKLQEYWFPQIKADVFISHSHRDESLAKILAGFLSIEFGLTSFIDSCVWGYADDLLWQIDNEFSKSGEDLFSYQTRNTTTSHIHMILSRALSMMMDTSECVLFLNTPNSITSKEVVEKTKSPWIYMEIGMTGMLRRNAPDRDPVVINENFSGHAKTASFHVEYDVSEALSALTQLNAETLRKWQEKHSGMGGNALDTLYGLLPLQGESDKTAMKGIP